MDVQEPPSSCSSGEVSVLSEQNSETADESSRQNNYSETADESSAYSYSGDEVIRSGEEFSMVPVALTWKQKSFILLPLVIPALMVLFFFMNIGWNVIRAAYIHKVGVWSSVGVGGLFLFVLLHFFFGVAYRRLRQKPVPRRVLIPYVLFGILAVLVTIVEIFFVAPYLAAVSFSAGPILTLGSRDGQDAGTCINIIWRTRFEDESKVLLGPTPESMVELSSGTTSSKFHQLSIDSLTPSTSYVYSVPGLGSTLYSFTTGPPSGSGTNLTFFYFSDARQNNEWDVWATPFLPNVPDIMAEEAQTLGIEQQFTIFGGDFSPDGPFAGTSNTRMASFKSFLDDIGPHYATKPLLLNPGNHERDNDPYGLLYGEVFGGSDPFHQSVTWGNVHISMVDLIAIGDRQDLDDSASQDREEDRLEAARQWLTADLRKAQAAGVSHKIVVSHQPVATVSWVTDLCAAYNVSLTLSGHRHGYVEETIGPTLCIINGLGGNIWNPWRAAGFSWIRASPRALDLTQIWRNGTLSHQRHLPALL